MGHTHRAQPIGRLTVMDLGPSFYVEDSSTLGGPADRHLLATVRERHTEYLPKRRHTSHGKYALRAPSVHKLAWLESRQRKTSHRSAKSYTTTSPFASPPASRRVSPLMLTLDETRAIAIHDGATLLQRAHRTRLGGLAAFPTC